MYNRLRSWPQHPLPKSLLLRKSRRDLMPLPPHLHLLLHLHLHLVQQRLLRLPLRLRLLRLLRRQNLQSLLTIQRLRTKTDLNLKPNQRGRPLRKPHHKLLVTAKL